MLQDSIATMTPDTVLAAVDSAKAVLDSAGAALGTQVGSMVAPWAALALGAVTKLITEFMKPLIEKYQTLPSWAKAGLALGIAQAITFVNGKLGGLGVPALPTDVTLWTTMVPGLVVWAAAMGVNSLKDALIKKAA